MEASLGEGSGYDKSSRTRCAAASETVEVENHLSPVGMANTISEGVGIKTTEDREASPHGDSAKKLQRCHRFFWRNTAGKG